MPTESGSRCSAPSHPGLAEQANTLGVIVVTVGAVISTLANLAALLVLLVAPAVGVLAAEHRSARRVGRLSRDRGPARPRPIAITDARTGAARLVTDAAAARGRLRGRYEAICGARVLAASLTAPATGMCRCCVDRVARGQPPVTGGVAASRCRTFEPRK